MMARRHELSNLTKLGECARWCKECNKQWGPYDTVDEAEVCGTALGRPAASSLEAAIDDHPPTN